MAILNRARASLDIAKSSGMGDRVDLHFWDADGDSIYVGQPVTMQKIEPGAISRPTASIGRDAARELMDDLWRAGIRPTDYQNNGDEVAAVSRHLEDMRTLAFGKLNMEKPENARS